MARGHQKVQSQQKAAAKKAQMAKSGSQLKDRVKAQQEAVKCEICKQPMASPGTYKQHFESKHPKAAAVNFDAPFA